MENQEFTLALVALILSALGAISAIVSVVFTAQASLRAEKAEQRAEKAEGRAERSEQRAIQAEESAEKQRQFSLWGDAINGLQEMVTYHALTPEIPAKLMNLRIALTELSDGLPEEDFPRLDEFMAGIHSVTALLYERSIFQVSHEDGSVDSISSAHEPIVKWLSGCIGNLRILRRTVDKTKRDEWIVAGIENCDTNYLALNEEKSRNWGLPEGWGK